MTKPTSFRTISFMKIFALTLMCSFLPWWIFAQGISYGRQDLYVPEPAFEKIYIFPQQLVSMPDGLYYYDNKGEATKVKTVLGDEDGMYLILVKYQCPLCGHTHNNTTPEEGYGCPIFMRQVHPKIWSRS